MALSQGSPRTIRVSKKIKSIFFAAHSTFPTREETSTKLRSPPPMFNHSVEDEEDKEVDYDNFPEHVEITDIAEKRKEVMEETEDDSDSAGLGNQKSHLLHSASFYGYSGAICPNTPAKSIPAELSTAAYMAFEEKFNGDWEKEEEELEVQRGHAGVLVKRSDTKTCLIIPADWCLTPRKVPSCPSPFSVEEEEEETEEEEQDKVDKIMDEMDKNTKEEEIQTEEKIPNKEIMIVVNINEQNLDDNKDSDAASIGSESGEDESDTKKENLPNGPRKDQTEHRLVIKVNKKAKNNILMVPLETIRMRRRTLVDINCPYDILNYV